MNSHTFGEYQENELAKNKECTMNPEKKELQKIKKQLEAAIVKARVWLATQVESTIWYEHSEARSVP